MKIIALDIHRNKLLVVLFVCFVRISYGQQEPLSTQYINSQLIINPAYAGVRNAFSMNLMARHQWMGMKGAPVNYWMAVHSPLNKSRVSLGGALQSYQAGPIQNHRLNLYYAYLVRLRHDMFLSMGVSATGNYFNLLNDKLEVIDQDDPSFVNDVSNAFNPNFGAGAFVYTPTFYFGVSMPYALENKFRVGEESNVVMQTRRNLFLSTGYGFGVGKKVYLKPSMLWRIAGKSSSFDVNMQMLYEESFSAGVSYRLEQAIAFLVGFRINKTFQIAYSYDLPIGEVGITKGSHEITLNFDSFSMIRRNKDRRFLRKKKEEEGSMRSIRYF